jgi:arabinofuranosyltransferase
MVSLSPPSTPSKTKSFVTWLAFLALLVVALIELLNTAWLSDDSAITLRTILNFNHGYGAVFNIGERVQAYTHPLWFLLLSLISLVSPNPMAAAFICSITLSLGVLCYLIWRVGSNVWAAIFGASLLLLSKSYVDFSTSGLENPLSHLLILLFYTQANELARATNARQIHHRQLVLYVICALLILTRQDLLIMALPILIWASLIQRKALAKTFKNVVLGFSPYLAWLVISLFYYGFIVPNTAFAKLNTGIPTSEKLTQGMHYTIDLATHDPLTFVVIVLGTIVGFKGTQVNKLAATGICLYLAYIISIGGDFMSGRFFTVPFLLAIGILITTPFFSRSYLGWLSLITLGMFNIHSTLLSPKVLSHQMHDYGIADERSYFYKQYSLRALLPTLVKKIDWEFTQSRVQVGCGLMGFHSIQQGANLFFIDSCALADPLLSKLPPQYHHPYWRIGHFVRQLPTNYERSVQENSNLLSDPVTKEYYDHIRAITRGEILDLNRFISIFKVNLRKVKTPNFYDYQFGFIPTDSQAKVIKFESIQGKVAASSIENRTFTYSAEIRLSEITSINSIDFQLMGKCSGKLEFLYEGFFVPFLDYDNRNHQQQAGNIEIINPATMLTNRIRVTNTEIKNQCIISKLFINPI